MLSSQTLAPVGQFLIQAQQRMHKSIFVSTCPLIEMAAVGHTPAHVPQTVHVSSLVTGAAAMDRGPPSYGNLPGISKSVWASGDCSAVILSLILVPKPIAFWISRLSGRPFAMGTSFVAKECSPMNAPPATGIKPRSSARFFNSNSASSNSRFPYTTMGIARVLSAFTCLNRLIASTGRRPP